MNSYATDGRCHNAEPGTYGHECGKPAKWIGTSAKSGHVSGFCQDCKDRGYEARHYGQWKQAPRASLQEHTKFSGTKQEQ
jgi:hypothetical protein